jgi:hypothetical protein
MTNLSFLVDLWKKDSMETSASAKVEKLIHNVGVIKGNILQIINKEKNKLN